MKKAMFKHTEILDNTKHRTLKLKPVNNFNFARQQSFAPINYTEMMIAARDYAIVFPKTSDDTQNPLPVVLLGLTGTNRFVDQQGKWTNRYIPAHFRRYPFILGSSPQNNGFSVMIDTDSECLSNDQGEALFDSEGKQTETLAKVIEFLGLFQKEAALTMELVKTLRASGVLMEQQIQQQVNGENQTVITGFEAIDQAKLNALDSNLFIQWRNQGLLPLIYAHLSSLENIRQLI